MQEYNCLSLFSGIGGFDLAAKWVGVTTTQFVEIDLFCQRVLAKNFPGVPIYDDITTFTANSGEFDFITFGSPCQDLSVAGKQRGIKGDRSGLFFHAVRLIEEVQPVGFIMENVTGAYKWLPEIVDTLTQVGDYHIYWFTLSAATLGGCHRRERFFCVGVNSNPQGKRSRWARSRYLEAKADQAFSSCGQSKGEEIEPRVCSGNDGISSNVAQLMSREKAWAIIDRGESCDDRDDPLRGKKIKALGNAVIPQAAYIAWLVLFELMEKVNKER